MSRMAPPQPKHKVLQEGTRKHAQRKNPAEWKTYRPIICKKYKNEPLKDVMAFMEKEYNFKATKRQYVHQLKKWGEFKYNKGSNPIEPPLEGEGKSKVGKIVRKHRRNESSSSFDVSDTERKPRSRTLSNQDSVNTGEDDEMRESPETRWWADSYRGGVEHNHLHVQTMHEEDTSLALERKTRAADFFFAMSFDKTAFQLYQQCYDSLDECSGSPLISLRPSLVLAMARSAQLPEDMDTVRAILRRPLTMTDTETQTPMSFLCHMLEAYMSDRSKNRTSAKASIEDILNNLVLHRKRLLWPNEQQGLGIIPYPFLVYGIQRYNEGKEAPYCLDQQSIVGDFLLKLHQERDHRLNQIVLECVLWCTRVLERQLDISPIWQHIPCKDDDLRGWKDDYEIFCYLWHSWQTESPVGAPQPSWVEMAEQQLGISATELLVTISWLVSEEVDENDDDNSLIGGHLRLIQTALRNARILASLGTGELWNRFLARLDWMNTLVDIDPKDKDFKATTLQYVRDYVAGTLNLDMHAINGDCNELPDGPLGYPTGAVEAQSDLDRYRSGTQPAYQIHMNIISAQKGMSGMQLDLC